MTLGSIQEKSPNLVPSQNDPASDRAEPESRAKHSLNFLTL